MPTNKNAVNEEVHSTPYQSIPPQSSLAYQHMMRHRGKELILNIEVTSLRSTCTAVVNLVPCVFLLLLGRVPDNCHKGVRTPA